MTRADTNGETAAPVDDGGGVVGRSILPVAVAVVSVLVGAVGLLWTRRPSSYPFGPADRVTVSVTHLVAHDTAGAMLLTAALLGLVVVALVAAAGARTGPLRLAAALTALETLFFALVMADVSLMNSMAYGLGLVAPWVILATVVVACVRGSRLGWLAAGVLALTAAVSFGTGTVRASAIPVFLGNVGRSFAAFDTRVGWGVGMAATAAVWGWITYRLIRLAAAVSGAPGARPAWTRPENVRRWGRVVTIAAIVCPLPYGLLRLAWLTPWALDMEASYDDPATRLQGASLGVAAIVGAVLTSGLISRWGEVIPRWVPELGGRAVPPMLAVVPGGLVAVAAFVASPGLIVSMVEGGNLGDVLIGLLLFPFPLWGPLLGAAVLAYWLRRRENAAPPAELAGVPD